MNRFKVNNGKDVLNVLLTSERLFLDLKDWLNHGGREQMILRKWDDSLCSDREFRAFGKNGCYLYPLKLSAGQRGIDLTVDIVMGA